CRGIAPAGLVGADAGASQTDRATIAKRWPLELVPPALCTQIFPLRACFGTVATIEVADMILNVAFRVPNFTHFVPVKLAPRICTLVPTLPVAGEKLVMRGATTTFTAAPPVGSFRITGRLLTVCGRG